MKANGYQGFTDLHFILSRPLSAGEHLELVVGTTDVSDLCVLHGDTLLYQPRTGSSSPRVAFTVRLLGHHA